MMTINSLLSKRVLVVLTLVLLLVAIIPPITQAAPPRDGPAIYYVQYGDTLFSISRRFGTTVPALMAANGLMSDYIYAGQRLTLSQTPAGPTPTPSNYTCKYTVQPHDTIYNIAYRYQIPWASLAQSNYQYSPYQYGWTYLYVGQQLNVPCLTATPTPFPMYTIQAGDNLFRLAIKYGTSVYAIARVNGIPNPNWVWAGQNIVVPYPGTVQWPANIPTQVPYSTATPTVTGTPATATPTATTTSANTGVVIMQNIAFLPNVITIHTGQFVLWTNADSVTHTVSSGAPGALDGKFRSNQLAPGQSFSFTFTQVGSYPYFCEIHGASMTGTVNVLQ